MILENIAILIQKIWRGYRTRKLLRQYFEIWFNENLAKNQGNETLKEEEFEDEEDEDPVQFRQSHLNNNLYSENLFNNDYDNEEELAQSYEQDDDDVTLRY